MADASLFESRPLDHQPETGLAVYCSDMAVIFQRDEELLGVVGSHSYGERASRIDFVAFDAQHYCGLGRFPTIAAAKQALAASLEVCANA